MASGHDALHSKSEVCIDCNPYFPVHRGRRNTHLPLSPTLVQARRNQQPSQASTRAWHQAVEALISRNVSGMSDASAGRYSGCTSDRLASQPHSGSFVHRLGVRDHLRGGQHHQQPRQADQDHQADVPTSVKSRPRPSFHIVHPDDQDDAAGPLSFYFGLC